VSKVSNLTHQWAIVQWLVKVLIFGFCLLFGSPFVVAESDTSDVKVRGAIESAIDPAVETLFHLVRQRLSLMDEVANYKWQHKLPVEDLPRETLVLNSAVKNAMNFHLEPRSSRAFFSIQINAAKEIQQGWFDYWQNTSSPQVGRDLKKTIRPQLITLGKQILRQIELAREALDFSALDVSGQDVSGQDVLRKRFLQVVDVQYLSEHTKLKLFTALKQIKTLEKPPLTDVPESRPEVLNETRLSSILRRGEIKVGTTGDYAPFSWIDGDSGEYSGIDIEMARDLAASLGVRLVLVPTTWPNLADDFTADKFDLAMSGVSINLKRQRLGFFSAPYHSGGKTPISLCRTVDKYNTLSKIDRPKTRVIVNPGGTNFRFASSRLGKAKVRTFENNQTIFLEIAEGRADVMITDAIEVRLQSQHNKKLCAAMPGKTLTKSEKGYWLQADIHLKEYVNTWLHQRKIDGFVDGVFDKYLGSES